MTDIACDKSLKLLIIFSTTPFPAPTPQEARGVSCIQGTNGADNAPLSVNMTRPGGAQHQPSPLPYTLRKNIYNWQIITFLFQMIFFFKTVVTTHFLFRSFFLFFSIGLHGKNFCNSAHGNSWGLISGIILVDTSATLSDRILTLSTPPNHCGQIYCTDICLKYTKVNIYITANISILILSNGEHRIILYGTQYWTGPAATTGNAEGESKGKHFVWNPMPELTVTSPCVHFRSRLQHIYHRQPYASVDLTLNLS